MFDISAEHLPGAGSGSGRILSVRSGVGAAIQVRQFATTHCRRLSSIEPAIVLVKRGTKRVRDAGMELVMDEGVATVFPAGFDADIVNEVDAHGCYQALSVVFAPEAIAAHVSAAPALTRITPLEETPPGLAGAMESAVDAICDTTLPDPIARHRISELLVWLDRRGIRLSCPSQNDLVTNIKRIVASAPEVNWPAPDVAARLAMSEATMRRRLARTGTSLSKILLETRMLAALTLLQAGDQSVVQIAYAVGYESPSRFAGRFRERFGFAPSELRKRGS